MKRSALAQVLHQCNELPGGGMSKLRWLVEHRPELVAQAEAELAALSPEQLAELDTQKTERRNRMLNRIRTQRGQVTVGGVVAGLVILVLLFVGSWAMWGYSVASRTATGVVERTMDADNVLYNYEWFKERYQQIKAADSQIATAKAAVTKLEATPKDERDFRFSERLGQQEVALQGLRNNRDEQIATFNARARMANRNIFQGSDVPAQLSIDASTDKTVSVSQ